jgi:hypothetical protein
MSRKPTADSHGDMKREPDIDRLTTLLGQCLGRIDEQAYRLQQVDDDETLEGADDVLEQEAATLQELIGSMLEQTQAPDQSDLNGVIAAAVSACLGELQRPIVVRQRLEPDLPPVACSPGQLSFAVQRSLVLCTGGLVAGDELWLTSRRDGEQVVLELECPSVANDRNLPARSQTLCEFVAAMRGNCRVDRDDRGSLLVVLELPAALAIDEHGSAPPRG